MSANLVDHKCYLLHTHECCQNTLRILKLPTRSNPLFRACHVTKARPETAARLALQDWFTEPSITANHQRPVVITHDCGMVFDESLTHAQATQQHVVASSGKTGRRSVQYVSRHFVKQNTPASQTHRSKKTKDTGSPRSKPDDTAQRHEAATQSKIMMKTRKRRSSGTLKDESSQAVAAEKELVKHHIKDGKRTGRVFYGLDVDALASDSDLTDVPEDIGPDPFKQSSPLPRQKLATRSKKPTNELVVVKQKTDSKTTTERKGLTKSPYFPHPHKHRDTFLSTLPFPPLHLERFGLMQERLAHDPFRLLLATIFLNKTPGARAMPIFYKLMERYPTPEDLSNAEQADVTAIIQQLGFQNQRARKCIAMAQKWTEAPPVKGKRYRKLNYPTKGDHTALKADEVIDDDTIDPRIAWEIAHLPGLGPYSHDSWRMFCRDELRGLATSWNGESATEDSFEPEWKRVLPTDKELRAWMTWMWMKEGWVWNKETGKRTKASKELMDLARGEGNVVLEQQEQEILFVKALDSVEAVSNTKVMAVPSVKVDLPAGDFLPTGNG